MKNNRLVLLGRTHNGEDVLLCGRDTPSSEVIAAYREFAREQSNEKLAELSVYELAPVRPILRRKTKAELQAHIASNEKAAKAAVQSRKEREIAAKKKAVTEEKAKAEAKAKYLARHNEINARAAGNFSVSKKAEPETKTEKPNENQPPV